MLFSKCAKVMLVLKVTRGSEYMSFDNDYWQRDLIYITFCFRAMTIAINTIAYN